MDRGGLKEPEIVKFEKIKCAKFDGASALRIADTSLLHNLSKWTVQVWAYATSTGTYANQSMICTNYPMGALVSSNYFIIAYKAPNLLNSLIEANYTVDFLNGWHHIKVTCDGAKIYTYFDNKLVGEYSTNTVKRFASPNLSIGHEASNSGYNIGFYGYLTQFKLSDVYNDNDLPLNDNKFIYINKNNEVWAMV